eukprot:4122912-Ditylum_brightwellii.AAC.1
MSNSNDSSKGSSDMNDNLDMTDNFNNNKKETNVTSPPIDKKSLSPPPNEEEKDKKEEEYIYEKVTMKTKYNIYKQMYCTSLYKT